jgi:hypothetical protein
MVWFETVGDKLGEDPEIKKMLEDIVGSQQNEANEQ